jgi:hypothetical protein
MGPFEIAPGTQWDNPSEFEHGMFPPKQYYSRYAARAERKMPKMGDISARTGLAIHRGTANRSNKSRPVLILGVIEIFDSYIPGQHDLQVTKAYYESLPEAVRSHLACRVVDKLEPIVQAHTIEGLMMGEA